MCPIPPPLSPPSSKLMIMALEEYEYQSRRGIQKNRRTKVLCGALSEKNEFLGLSQMVLKVQRVAMERNIGNPGFGFRVIILCSPVHGIDEELQLVSP
ncbi:hypothetical protein Tco_1473366 [Tanacetum coccineum]